MQAHQGMAAACAMLLSCAVLPGRALSADATSLRPQYLLAQAQPDAPANTRRTANLTEQDRHVIREIILKESKVDRAPANVSVAIGDPAPEGVTLHAFPDDVTRKVSQLKASSFFIKGDEVVIVDPSKKVADIVK